MKHFISKVKKATKDFFTNKSAFSLVELIVVIAIMAVMAAVLAPALLGYVERSRAQKDDSSLDEVVNAVQLSLADQEIYDEVLEHSVWDNVSCYIDKKDESQFADCKVSLKAANGDKKEQYMFSDEARLLDETVYYAAGNMRGLTITFSPSESGDTYDFANGILNKFVGRKTGLLSENPELYNRLRSVIGDKLDTTSQTYRNSDYTIFIRVGSTGGSEAVMQDAIQVWGQFNGTNLTEKDHKYELSSGRVVGSAGANDAANNQNNNENGSVDFSESSIPLFTKLKSISWSGIGNFRGCNVWHDGTNTYYSSTNDAAGNYVLKDGKWESKTWDGFTGLNGSYVWTDGTNYYYSNNSNHYILHGNSWDTVDWTGHSFKGDLVWTDGINTYYSSGTKHYVFNGIDWDSVTWVGLTKFSGTNIWTDGINTYCSIVDSDTNTSSNYILRNNTWESISWDDGPSVIVGYRVLTVGNVAYLFDTDNNNQLAYVNGEWKEIIWNQGYVQSGSNTWTDGVNYYSASGKHYILLTE